MKPYQVCFFTKITAVLMLVPQILFGSGIFTPNIQNHGSYKQVQQLPYQNDLVPLYGHVPLDVNNAIQVAPMEESNVLTLSIVLPLNHEDELDRLLLQITDPRSPSYQQFLRQDEFVARYSPTADQVDNAQSYLEDHGMNIESVTSNRLILRATGTVGAINDIFHTEIHYYIDQEGKQFYAPAYELQVEDALKVLSVLGLENRIKAEPKFKVPKTTAKSNTDPEAGPSQGLTPAEIKTAYSVPSTLNGAGQTLALFELDGFTASDITAYENTFGLPNVPLDVVLVDGATGQPSGGGAAEVTLDIQLMIALAPGVAKIIVYEGPNSSTGLVGTYNRIATDNLAPQISTSWGLTEFAGSLLNSENAIFKQMVAQGQALYAASGDSGAYDNGSTLSVDDPASQPFVVGTGGTTLHLNSNGSYNYETTWSSGNGAGNEGGGGGKSVVWSIPSWQQGAITPASLGSTTMRNVPDISLDADPESGYAVYYEGSWTVFGGTSCAAPLWAALTALINQQRANNGLGVLGFPNPAIYQLAQSANYASTFNDIVQGTNGYYPAVPGYDLATGWGTYKASALIAALAGSAPPPVCTHANPTVAISPASEQSPAGGALSYTVSVTNNDSSACSASTFNLTASVPSGFSDSLSVSSLSIQPGQSASASLSVTSPANAAAGSYAFSVNGVNGGATSYSGSGSATYVVTAPSQTLNLSISPQNGSFVYGDIVLFTLTLTNGQTAVANNKINLLFQGPDFSWSMSGTTNANGIYQFYQYINSSLPVGQYKITATSQYQGSSVSSQTTFTVSQ